MLQLNNNDFILDAPIKGISSTASNDPEYAKYIENMLIAENKTLSLRNGTKLINSPTNTMHKEYFRTLSIMEYIKNNGDSQILTYLTYLQEIDTTTDVGDNVLTISKQRLLLYQQDNKVLLDINLDGLNQQKKNYLKKTFIVGANFSLIDINNIKTVGEIINIIESTNKLTIVFDFILNHILQTVDITTDDGDNNLSINSNTRFRFDMNIQPHQMITTLNINLDGLSQIKQDYLKARFFVNYNVELIDGNEVKYIGKVESNNNNNIKIKFNDLIRNLAIQSMTLETIGSGAIVSYSIEKAGIYLAETDYGAEYVIEAKIIETSCIELSKNLSSIIGVNVTLSDNTNIEIPTNKINFHPIIGQNPLVHADGTKYRNVIFHLNNAINLNNRQIININYTNKVRNTDYIAYIMPDHETHEILTGVYEDQIIELRDNLIANSELILTIQDGSKIPTIIRELIFTPTLDQPPWQYDDGTVSRRVHFRLQRGIDRHNEVITSLEYNTKLLFKDNIQYKSIDEIESYIPLVEDLDPAVFISHVFVENKLLICNGVDNNKIYDGTSLTDHYYRLSIENIDGIASNGNVIVVKINDIYTQQLQQILKINKKLVIVNDKNGEMLCNVVGDIVIGNVEQINNIDVRTININIDLSISRDIIINKLVTFKLVPPITICAFVQKRLFFTSTGRLYKKWTKQPESGLTVFFADKEHSLIYLVNEGKRIIDFLNLSSNIFYPDELLRIVQINTETIFFCRNSIHIFTGDNPTTLSTINNEIQIPTFVIKKVIDHIGIPHPNLVQEFPSFILFFTSSYELYNLAVVNQTLLLEALPIAGHINQQLKNEIIFLETDNDYRMISTFYYPYTRLFGLKIKTNTFILNVSSYSWVVFTENFAIANCFGIISSEQNLYLGMPSGKLLLYCDKPNNKIYTDNEQGKLPWSIFYHWLDFPDTWSNTYIYFISRSLKQTDVNVRLFIDKDESKSIPEEKIIVQQVGTNLDAGIYNKSKFSKVESNYSHELLKFQCDSLLVQLSGKTDDELIFYNLAFTGNVNRGTLYASNTPSQ